MTSRAATLPVQAVCPPLKAESLQCLHRFVRYKRRVLPHRIPKKRNASVAIVLFVGRLGDLYVLLSTRASEMRTYASDTALPGGKYEEGDEDEEGTARREAFEEIGLPVDKEKVRCLALLDPFLTGNGLIVTPVVLLITDNTIEPVLNPSEVTQLFSMPLAAFLHTRPSRIPGWHYGISTRIRSVTHPTVGDPPPIRFADAQGAVGIEGSDSYYNWRDVSFANGSVVRMHRFLTGREGGGVKPVYGLTAAILIHAAVVGYDQQPDFQVLADGQKPMPERVFLELKYGHGPLSRALEQEGMLMEWMEDEEGSKCWAPAPPSARARAKL